jgi:hypothetical protein
LSRCFSRPQDALDGSQLDGDAPGANRGEWSGGLKRLRLAACVAICATLLVSGCANGTATITGTLEGADGGCVYVHVPHANGTDLYWLRHLPSGYVADADGLGRIVVRRPPDGSLIKMGDSLTVSGVLSWDPFDRQCAGAQTLDATAIK